MGVLGYGVNFGGWDVRMGGASIGPCNPGGLNMSVQTKQINLVAF